MKMLANRWIIAIAALALAACSGDLNRASSPVELIVTNTQSQSHIDLQTGAANCGSSIGTINIEARIKNSSAPTSSFNDVRITRYQVSYVRTDGGHTVPASFVRSTDTLITTPGTGSLGQFLVVDADALTQAPFAALLPINGGRDPETGRPVVRMDVIVQLFGQTLAGENVAGTTRFPLDFCYDCGGCS